MTRLTRPGKLNLEVVIELDLNLIWIQIETGLLHFI